jgi:hypothetical protein
MTATTPMLTAAANVLAPVGPDQDMDDDAGCSGMVGAAANSELFCGR